MMFVRSLTVSTLPMASKVHPPLGKPDTPSKVRDRGNLPGEPGYDKESTIHDVYPLTAPLLRTERSVEPLQVRCRQTILDGKPLVIDATS